jgi:pimeloyl-ACP methyl ester carboxylesterase
LAASLVLSLIEAVDLPQCGQIPEYSCSIVGSPASFHCVEAALPTLEQWADSITAVLDDLGSREAVLLGFHGSFAPAALFAATHPSRTTALVVLEGYASDPTAEWPGGQTPEELRAAVFAMWGTGGLQHMTNPDMPWNEEIQSCQRLPTSMGSGRPGSSNVTLRASCGFPSRATPPPVLESPAAA